MSKETNIGYVIIWAIALGLAIVGKVPFYCTFIVIGSYILLGIILDVHQDRLDLKRARKRIKELEWQLRQLLRTKVN